METEGPHLNMPSAVWEAEPRDIGSRGTHLAYHWSYTGWTSNTGVYIYI